MKLVNGCPLIEIPPASTPICIIVSSTTTSIRPDIPSIENTTTVHITDTDVTPTNYPKLGPTPNPTPQPTNDPKPGPTTNPIPLPQENEMSIDISVNDINTAFDADDDDDDSTKTDYKTKEIRADTVNVNIIEDDSYNEKSNMYYDNIDNETVRTEYECTIVFEGAEDTEESNTDVNTTNGNNVNMNIIEDESYISQRQMKALSNAEITFIKQVRIEIQQQEQQEQKWEQQQQDEQAKDTITTTTKDEEVCTTSEDEFTTSTTTEEEEDEKSNNYYDNIDNEILRTEYEDTIVFEDNSSAPTTIRIDIPNNILIEDLLTTKNLVIIIGLLNEDTLDFVT